MLTELGLTLPGPSHDHIGTRYPGHRMNADTQQMAIPHVLGRVIGGFLYFGTMMLIATPWIPGFTAVTSLIVACFVGPFVAVAFVDQHRQLLERLEIYVRPGRESCSFRSGLLGGMRTSRLVSFLSVPFLVCLGGVGSLLLAALSIVLDGPQAGVRIFVDAMSTMFWWTGICLSIAVFVGAIFRVARLVVSRVRLTHG